MSKDESMETAELLELLSPEGLRLLDSLPKWHAKDDVVRSVAQLRKAGYSGPLVAAVLSQARLRARAEEKFGAFAERMLFTEAGLEQATRLSVAAIHAGRFRDAGVARVTDLGCGIGADALAFASLDLSVRAVERDEVTAAVAAFNLAPWPNAVVVNADAESVDLSDTDAVYLDPARRDAGRRLSDPADWSPSLDFAFGLATQLPAGVKLGPGIDRDLLPDDAEAQWISVNREVVEVGVWFGSLARPGVRRAALVIGQHGAAEMVASADSDDEAVGELGEYVVEPDGSVIRARLIGDLARSVGAKMLSESIAYLTCDSPVSTPFGQCFRVLERFPLDEKLLRKELAQRGIGSLEIKKRGVDIDPAVLRTKLALTGGRAATLVVTRIAGARAALLCERVI